MKKHRPMAKYNPYSASFFMQPSKEAGASTASFGDGRDHGVGKEWLQTLFKVTQSTWCCKDLSQAFQILFFLLLVPDRCTVSSHTILLKLFCWWEGADTQVWLTYKSGWRMPTEKEGARGTYTDLSSAPFRIQTQPLTLGSHISSWTRNLQVSVRRYTPDRHNGNRNPTPHSWCGERNGWERGRKEGVNFLRREGGKQLSLDASLLPGPGLPPTRFLLCKVWPSLPVVIHPF